MQTCKLYFLIFTIIFSFPIIGKTQSIHYPDSIKEIKGLDKMTDLDKVDTLYHIAHGCPDPEKTLYFANASLALSKKING